MPVDPARGRSDPAVRPAATLGVIAIAFLAGACATASGDPGPPPTDPPGTLMSVERAQMTDDHRTVWLSTTGWAPFAIDDRCSARYEGWAEPVDGVLRGAIRETVPPRTLECDLLGHPVTIAVPLLDAYDGWELDDVAGGVVLLRAPDRLATVGSMPDGWELREQTPYRSDAETGFRAIWRRTYAPAPLTDEWDGTGRLWLDQELGGAARRLGAFDLDDTTGPTPVTVNGAPAQVAREPRPGLLTVLWTLGPDRFRLTAKESELSQAQLIAIAASVRIPTGEAGT